MRWIFTLLLFGGLFGTTESQLHIVQPDGTKPLEGGKATTIMWSGCSRFDRVNIEYRVGSGSEWRAITQQVTGLSYAWSVPAELHASAVTLRIRRVLPMHADSTVVRVIAGGFGNRVVSSITTHDNSSVFSAGNDGTMREFDLNTGEYRAEWRGADERSVLAVSPNDRWIACSYGQQALFIDRTDRSSWSIEIPSTVTVMKFDPTSSSIAIGLIAGGVVIVDVTSRTKIGQLPHTGRVNDLDISSDGRMIVTACSDSSARVWEIASGVMLHVLRAHMTVCTSARFSPIDNNLVTTGQKGCAYVWDRRSGRRVDSLCHDVDLRSASYAKSGKLVVTAGTDGNVHVWSTDPIEYVRALGPHSGAVSAASGSADGQYILSFNGRSDARIWSTTTGAEVLRLQGQRADLTSAIMSDDSRCVTSSADAGVRIYDLKSATPILCIGNREVGAGFQGRVVRASFDRSDRYVLATSEDGAVHTWDALSGTAVRETAAQPYAPSWVDQCRLNGNIVATHIYRVLLTDEQGTQLGVYSTEETQRTLGRAFFSPRGSWIVVVPDRAYNDTTITVLDGGSAVLQYQRSVYGESVLDAAVSPDERYLATIHSGGILRIRELASGEERAVKRMAPYSLGHLAFSPDGTTLAVHGVDPRVWFMNMQSLQITDSLDVDQNLYGSAWHPSSKIFATASIGRVSVYDLLTRRRLLHDTIAYHFSNATDLTFSNDGARLAVMNTNVDVYETAMWKRTHSLKGRNLMEHIQFDSTGQRLLCVALNDRPLVWDLHPKHEDIAESVPSIAVTDVSESLPEPYVVVTPLPATDHVLIHADHPIEQVEIVTLEGVVIYRFERFDQSELRIAMHDHPAGMYVLRVHMPGVIKSYPVIVQH